MPSYEDFKVGDVWIGKEGVEYEILDLNPATKEVLVKIGTRGYWCTTQYRYIEWGYRIGNLHLTHKKEKPNTPLGIAAKIAASQARIEGMKAKNYGRESNGEALAYDSHDFFAEAQLLEQLADEAVR